MAHYTQDPSSYFIDKVRRFPTVTQQRIIDSMDSVQFTLIPYGRLHGTTKALESYAEWEFLNSQDAIKISYVSTSKHNAFGLFEGIRKFSTNRERIEHNGNSLVIESTESVLKHGSLRGLTPSDVYIFDATLGDLSADQNMCRFIQETKQHIGRTATHRIDSNPPRVLTKTYHGSRFVIVCADVEFMTQSLLDMGVDEEEISPVELHGSPLDLKALSRIIPGTIATDLIGIQPMTLSTGQIFKLNYQPSTSNMSLQSLANNGIILANP